MRPHVVLHAHAQQRLLDLREASEPQAQSPTGTHCVHRLHGSTAITVQPSNAKGPRHVYAWSSGMHAVSFGVSVHGNDTEPQAWHPIPQGTGKPSPPHLPRLARNPTSIGTPLLTLPSSQRCQGVTRTSPPGGCCVCLPTTSAPSTRTKERSAPFPPGAPKSQLRGCSPAGPTHLVVAGQLGGVDDGVTRDVGPQALPQAQNPLRPAGKAS